MMVFLTGVSEENLRGVQEFIAHTSGIEQWIIIINYNDDEKVGNFLLYIKRNRLNNWIINNY